MALDENKVLRRTPNLSLPIYKDGELGWGEAISAMADSIDTAVSRITIVNGARWLFGAGMPASALGRDGDLYLDLVSAAIYQKSVVWAFVANFTDLVAANVQAATALAVAAKSAAQLAQVETEQAINNIGFDVEGVAAAAQATAENRAAAEAALAGAVLILESVQLAQGIVAANTTAAGQAQVSAETAQGLAEAALSDTQTAKAGAIEAQAGAEEARDLALEYAQLLSGTSTTANSVGTGSKSFTTQTGRQWLPGQRLRASNDTATHVMDGVVASYTDDTLVLDVDYSQGTGTGSQWNLMLTGSRGAVGGTGGLGTSAGIGFTFNTSTSIADPGVGGLILNNGILANVTSIAVDDQSAASGNPSIAPWVATWADSDSSAKGVLVLQKRGTESSFAIYSVSAISVQSGYTQVSVTHVASSGSFSAADIVQVGFYQAGDRGEDGDGVGDMLASVYDPTGIESSAFARSNHTGTQSADTLTDGSGNKVFTSGEKTKLSGIETEATANSADSFLLARANHTGSQAASTISDFADAADARISAATGVSVQGHSENLDDYAGVAPTAAGLALLDDANAGAQRTTLGLGTAALLASDSDGEMAADSDDRLPTQKAVRAYVGANSGVSDGDKGDVVVSSDGVVWTVDVAALQGDGLDVDSVGFRGLPINTQNGNYTCVAADSGKAIYKASGGGGETFTIPSNASVEYEVGTALTFINNGGGNLSIAITSNTLVLAGAGTTGTRTLADHGIATAVKVASTTWFISGVGLT